MTEAPLSSEHNTDAELPLEVYEWLQKDQFVVVASVAPDGWPTTHVVSWALALDRSTIRLSVRHASPTIENIRHNGRLMLELIGDGIVMGVRGPARILKEHMASTPWDNALVEMQVEAIVDHLLPGMQMQGPRWGSGQRSPEAQARVEAVYRELREG